MGLDWINELNLIHFSDENEICQTPTLELTNAENLVRGCNQCQHVTKILHLTEIRFSQDSVLNYHSGPTKGATCTTVINSHSKGSDVALLTPTTSRSAISISHKLMVYQKG
ncbi:hypothetical protein ACTXT7_012848 [Hymenolepis weldensis]